MVRGKRKTPYVRHTRLHEASYWASRANVRITEWTEVWSKRDKLDFIARSIIGDATDMVANNLEELDLSLFVTPIKNDVSFNEWLENWD